MSRSFFTRWHDISFIYGKLAIERGGTKMTQEDLRQFVEDLFLPRYLERNTQ